jgi:valyl-tRNA synthetase
MKNLETYNFAEREEHWRKSWEENGVYRFDEQLDAPVYSVDTPPPYVTAAHLHTGHILSYSQAEFIVRYKRMQGFNVLYPMGFDDNGYPTERYVEKKYEIDKAKIKREEFIALCLKDTKVGAENYKTLWNQLGISVDWTRTYSTIDSRCQRVSQRSFLELLKKGVLYRRNEPTLWCPTCQTALAQADLEDKESESFMNSIDFLIDGEPYTIATTRPELLPACVALFANPTDERYSKLKGKKARVPLSGHAVPILFDASVASEFGTGLMMVCTWGDAEDVRKVREFNLEPRAILERGGILNALAGQYQGLRLKEARKSILEDLKKEGSLRDQNTIKHITNVHERCETPVEFIPTTQWFISVLDIKGKLLEKGRQLHWYPAHMSKRYEDWVSGVKWDWCISRQRYYGVPIPVWYCKNCETVIPATESALPVDPKEVKPPIDACNKCGSKEFIPEADVMDTWATSSCTPFIIPELAGGSTLRKQVFPNSLRPQAFEIIRTWIFYSMIKAHYHFDSIPFHNVMISGHGLDEQGRKISKRLGNYVEPEKLLTEYGADAIRYWATGATLGSNHRFDSQDVKKGKHTVNKLWNAAKFCSMYIQPIYPETPTLEPEDRWILHTLNIAIQEATEAFERYEYSDVRGILDRFFWGTFCDYYLEIVKHRATEAGAGYAMYHCLKNILKMYAPLLPFVTEEIYQNLFMESESAISIHRSNWPEVMSDWKMNAADLDLVEQFIREVDAGRKEKATRGLRFKDEMPDYLIQGAMDRKIFGDKLRKVLNVKNFAESRSGENS